MGWASYREDIESRLARATRTRSAGPATRRTKRQVKKVVQRQHPEEQRMSKLRDFTVSSARPLPVFLLADVSGSMAENGKITTLNAAVKEMLAAFAEEDNGRAEIQVAVITFGDKASLHIPLQSANKVQWTPMRAIGKTPLGAALDIVIDLLEDRQQVPGRAYRPTIILISDGLPNDDWRGPLAKLLNSERAKKAQRFALSIGADADADVLRTFLDDPKGRVFQAHEAREIKKLFRWITMSVISRSRSAQPNQIADLGGFDLEDYGDF
jgi:uncharacterized protein YegL